MNKAPTDTDWQKQQAKVTHKYSTEILVHYQCGNPHCKQWWTIGDGPTASIKLNCPKCGEIAKIEAKASEVIEWE